MADSASWEDLFSRLRTIGEQTTTGTYWWQLWSCIIAHPWYLEKLTEQASHASRHPATIRQHSADLQQEAILLLARDLQRSPALQSELTAGGAHVSGLLVRILQRHCLQARRRLVREKNVEPLPAGDVPMRAPIRLGDPRIELSEQLKSLPADQRELVALALNGWTQCEMAQRLGVHQSTVSRRLSRALATLSQHVSGSASGERCVDSD